MRDPVIPFPSSVLLSAVRQRGRSPRVTRTAEELMTAFNSMTANPPRVAQRLQQMVTAADVMVFVVSPDRAAVGLHFQYQDHFRE